MKLRFLLRQRSQEKELLDLGPDYYTSAECEHCLKLLFRVHKIFGVFSSTVKILKKFPKDASLLDIGCGDGLFILHLSRYFPKMEFVGIDISPAAIQLAQQTLEHWDKRQSNTHISFKLQPNPKLNLAENTVDIILINMVCHHLNDEELVVFLRNTLHSARSAVIINDLHRHPLSHWFFQLTSPLLFRNRLAMQDGLISIRRGFVRSEWLSLLKQANIEHFELKWCFPFRWRLILWKQPYKHC